MAHASCWLDKALAGHGDQCWCPRPCWPTTSTAGVHNHALLLLGSPDVAHGTSFQSELTQGNICMMLFAALMPEQALGHQDQDNCKNWLKNCSLGKPNTLFASSMIFSSFYYICQIPYQNHLYFFALDSLIRKLPPFLFIYFFKGTFFFFLF